MESPGLREDPHRFKGPTQMLANAEKRAELLGAQHTLGAAFIERMAKLEKLKHRLTKRTGKEKEGIEKQMGKIEKELDEINGLMGQLYTKLMKAEGECLLREKQ